MLVWSPYHTIVDSKRKSASRLLLAASCELSADLCSPLPPPLPSSPQWMNTSLSPRRSMVTTWSRFARVSLAVNPFFETEIRLGKQPCVCVCVRVQALGMLFWHKHNIEKSLADLPNFTPFPDEWTVEDKVLFEQAFSFHGKSFHRIQQMVKPDPAAGSTSTPCVCACPRRSHCYTHCRAPVFCCFFTAAGQVHLQSGQVLLLVEKDSFQNQSDGSTGPETGHQEQPG